MTFKNITDKEKSTIVRAETMLAYADCNIEDQEISKKQRNLSFKSSYFLSRDEVKEILKKAIPRGYNDFDPISTVNEFPEDSEIKIAREGSVCLYVKGKSLPKYEDIEEAQEIDKEKDGTVRYWFD